MERNILYNLIHGIISKNNKNKKNENVRKKNELKKTKKLDSIDKCVAHFLGQFFKLIVRLRIFLVFSDCEKDRQRESVRN